MANYAGAFAASGFTSSFENCHVLDTIVTGNRFVGGITGTCYGDITNCTVVGTAEGKTVISAALNRSLLSQSGDNVAAIVGLMGEGSMRISGCTVNGVSVQGTRQVAGIAGVAQYGNFIENNTVSNTTLHATATNAGSFFNRSAAAGGVVGQIQPGDSIITITNNTVDNLTVTRGGSTMHYCGWLIGDITRGTNYTATGNSYVGTPSLPEIYGAN